MFFQESLKNTLDLNDLTKKFIMKRWPNIPPEALKHYITNLSLPEILKHIPDHLDTLQKDKKYDLIIDYIWKFDLFDMELDWISIIDHLLVSLFYSVTCFRVYHSLIECYDFSVVSQS